MKDEPVHHIVLDLLVPELPTNKTLKSEYGVGRVDDGLALGWQSDKTFSVFCEGDDGRCRTRTLGVLDDARGFSLHNGHT